MKCVLTSGKIVTLFQNHIRQNQNSFTIQNTSRRNMPLLSCCYYVCCRQDHCSLTSQSTWPWDKVKPWLWGKLHWPSIWKTHLKLSTWNCCVKIFSKTRAAPRKNAWCNSRLLYWPGMCNLGTTDSAAEPVMINVTFDFTFYVNCWLTSAPKMETICLSEKLVSTYNSIWRQNRE
jgi:hypothetical protein